VRRIHLLARPACCAATAWLLLNRLSLPCPDAVPTACSPCARRRALSVMPSLTRVIACTLRSSSESIHAPPGVQRELTYISLVVLPACSRPPSSRLAFESPGRRVAWPSSRLSSCRLVASLCQGQVTSATSSLKSIKSSQASKVNQVMSSQA
jgi:hypothetical protein